ncbi:molybdenum cofactor biosynthesis protein MoaD [Coprococcus comes]|uniref:Molybdenum cofactor biosynthesis protein MoaD n=1 Tax=Coprococcus comes TaxID=410072 RepID=A0A3R5ZQT5_9FIRM|nr:molybdenum cofactor biosynthesis protein MoaD [Coprococcus comes]
MIYWQRCRLLYWHRGEVYILEELLSLILAVVAGVISHLICKWLDGKK